MFSTTEELLRQIQVGEDSSLELKDLKYKGNKVSDPHRNSMADELAAIANAATGTVILGVDDTTKSITGIPSDKLDVVETWVRGICADLIEPQLFCQIHKVILPTEEGDKTIIRMDIPKSLYVHKSPGGYFRRVGSSKRQMSPETLARLFQQRSQARIIRFDEQAVSTAQPNDISSELTAKFRTSLSPTNEKDFLQKLRLLVMDDDGEIRPSVTGILLGTENPERWLPNAFIQAVAYRGKDRNAAYQMDARDITGPLDRQILDACRFVAGNMKTAAEKIPARRDIPQYSMQAVFEAIVNTVAHRDYAIQDSKIRLHMFADRLEVFSPGAIPNTMTVDTMAFRQAARNELITSLLARCPMPSEGYNPHRESLMDKRGEGVPIILQESEKLSGRKPDYRLLDDSELLLTIYAAEPPRNDSEDA